MKLSWLKLAWIAAICVIKTMREGHIKYPDESWAGKNRYTHAMHAKLHAFQYLEGSRKEDDISHMITRGAMIKYLEEK